MSRRTAAGLLTGGAGRVAGGGGLAGGSGLSSLSDVGDFEILDGAGGLEGTDAVALSSLSLAGAFGCCDFDWVGKD